MNENEVLSAEEQKPEDTTTPKDEQASTQASTHENVATAEQDRPMSDSPTILTPQDTPTVPPPTQGGKRWGCWSILWVVLKSGVRHWKFTLGLLVVALIGYGILVAYRTISSTDTVKETPIDASPEEIVHLRAIGQWEFLSVDAEELVERHSTGMLSQRDLVCIYRGTLRIGIDMHKLPTDWVEVTDRRALLHLPQPSLLDEDFLDESRTTIFFEQGVFRPEERSSMAQEAKTKMKKRALTAENLSIARRNAEAQFEKLFLAMGYSEVAIVFDRETTQELTH